MCISVSRKPDSLCEPRESSPKVGMDDGRMMAISEWIEY